LAYFWASFDRLLDGNFYSNLATPLAQLAVTAAVDWPGCCNLGGLVMETLHSGMPTHARGLPRLPRCTLTSFILHLLSIRGQYRKTLK